MKPIAMSFQLVLNDKKQLAAEVEVIFEDGSNLVRSIPANSRFTLHFDDLYEETKDGTLPGNEPSI